MSDAGVVVTYELCALLCSWEGWIAASARGRGSTDLSLSSSSLMAPLDDFKDFHLQITHAITNIMNTGTTTEGTMILICLFPPLVLLPVFACEDEVDEREEEAAEDVGD